MDIVKVIEAYERKKNFQLKKVEKGFHWFAYNKSNNNTFLSSDSSTFFENDIMALKEIVERPNENDTTILENISIKKNSSSEKKIYKDNLNECAPSNISNLFKHKQIHSVNNNEKQYICNFCDKGFHRAAYLKSHKLIHTGKKPHICMLCYKGFNRPFLLQRHLIIHTIVGPYRCEICNKSYQCQTYLDDHKLIHLYKKPFRCNNCDKNFRQASDLKTHKLTHTGQKPINCEICNKCFIRSFDLKRHLKIHNRVELSENNTGEKPLKCNFTRNSSLIHHFLSSIT